MSKESTPNSSKPARSETKAEQTKPGQVHVVTEGPVAIVTIDCYEYRNSLGAPGIRDGLHAAQDKFENDKSLRAMVLTGANQVFSAGGNLNALKAVPSVEKMRERFVHGSRLMDTLLNSKKIYIAAVEGPAFGAGMGLAIGCDLVVASSESRYCAAQVRVGGSPDGSLFWTLPFRVGMGRARRILLTGEEVHANDAQAMGLVDECCAPGEALEVAIKHARRLANGPPLSQAIIKQMFAQYPHTMDHVLAAERDAAVRAFTSEDFKEGATAFLEKRRPHFRGK
ncbi:MAG: enoyl-CoA hydratase/isomerase family protein [Burkholderiaceae bacterium]